MRRVSIIVAASENGVIGRHGDMPWRLSADLQRFKRLTMGSPIIMGRKTWESIGRPLPGRTSIVVSRQSAYQTDHPEVRLVGSFPEALETAGQAPGGDDEIFVIGGAQIYALALPVADRLYYTRVLATVDGDARFPEIRWDQWRLTKQEPIAADEKNEYDQVFHVYDRQ